LALVQMLVAKQLLAKNVAVCGSIYNASDDVVGTNSEFFGPIIKGAGWGVYPLVDLPAGLLQNSAYCLEAICHTIRQATGWRSVVPPLNCVEAAKATMDNYQNVSKAKRDLGFVAIPQVKLMEGMAAFSKSWVERYAKVPAVPAPFWAAVVSGMSLTLVMSFADTKRFDGAPWRVLKTMAEKLVPSMASMSIERFQRQVFRMGICMPMLSIHFIDAIVAAYLAKKKGHQHWMTYGLRTTVLGFGQLRHLLPNGAAGPYGVLVAAAFCASALAARKVR